jgi:hypothetical protein
VRLLEEILDAHGGADRWRAAGRISARVRSGGLLLRTRAAGNHFADYRVEVEIEDPRGGRPVSARFPTMVSLRLSEIEVA